MELRRILLISALLIAVIFTVPEVYSLFSGQHSFYDKGTIYCLKCHSNIRLELDSSAHHMSFSCENCHGLDTGSNLTHENVVNPGCLDCHGSPPRIVTDSNNNTFLSPVAKIFGENVSATESHTPFIEGAGSNPFMQGENEACISCHTAKSLTISMLYADTYQFGANRLTDGTWQISNYSKNIEVTGSRSIQSGESAGQHTFQSTVQLKCEKCHPDIRSHLNSSAHHTYFSCDSCHQLNSVFHASDTPLCLDCHNTSPRTVTDEKGNTFLAPVASVYADGQGEADAHKPFVLSANNSNLAEGGNIACTSCHSSFNNIMDFIRPAFIEWDVVNLNGTWIIQNLNFGPDKEVKVTKYFNGRSHNTSMVSGTACTSCHEDIKQAVSAGGHSNEQWRQRHDPANYADMDSYCRSCHIPQTQNGGGTSPYPAYPFNSPVHGGMKISCFDCHSNSDLFANINGAMRSPPYSSGAMGSIETSIGEQPVFVQSYLCMACKNANNPVPNDSLHFKLYTEPQVTVYIDGIQQYP